jgi:hypothetical protein
VFFFAMIFAIAMDCTDFLRLGQGAPRALRRPQGGDGRLTGSLRPSHLRRRRRHGRGVLHLCALRATAAACPTPRQRSRLLGPTRLHKQGPWTHLVGRPPGKAGVLDL